MMWKPKKTNYEIKGCKNSKKNFANKLINSKTFNFQNTLAFP